MTRTEAHNGVERTFRFWVSDYEAILGLTIILVLVGSLNVFSSSFVVAGENYDDPYFFLRKQGMNLGVGFVCFLIGFVVDYHLLTKARKLGFFIVTAMLIAVAFMGVEVNGAQRWLALGPMQIQPAEFAKPAAIFLEAYYIAWRVNHGMQCKFLHNEIYMIGLMAVLVEQEPDMGTALIISGVPLMMLVCSNMKRATKFKLFGMGIGVGALLCILQPYRLKRVLALFDPWGDAQGAGYQIVQSLQAIGSGGIWGMGMGMGGGNTTIGNMLKQIPLSAGGPYRLCIFRMVPGDGFCRRTCGNPHVRRFRVLRRADCALCQGRAGADAGLRYDDADRDAGGYQFDDDFRIPARRRRAAAVYQLRRNLAVCQSVRGGRAGQRGNSKRKTTESRYERDAVGVGGL